ncbi:MAG: hypothetical protein K0Q87_434 [Neobacillus sp.]|nr:hypothetical protein [Neobacillus sp.]
MVLFLSQVKISYYDNLNLSKVFYSNRGGMNMADFEIVNIIGSIMILTYFIGYTIIKS